MMLYCTDSVQIAAFKILKVNKAFNGKLLTNMLHNLCEHGARIHTLDSRNKWKF